MHWDNLSQTAGVPEIGFRTDKPDAPPMGSWARILL